MSFSIMSDLSVHGYGQKELQLFDITFRNSRVGYENIFLHIKKIQVKSVTGCNLIHLINASPAQNLNIITDNFQLSVLILFCWDNFDKPLISEIYAFKTNQ